jgi:hypothetical protein
MKESGDDLVEVNQHELCSHCTSPLQCMLPTWVMPQQLRAPESSPHNILSSSQSSSLRASSLHSSTASPIQASGDSSIDSCVGLRYTHVYSKYIIPNASYLANISQNNNTKGHWVGLQKFLPGSYEAVQDNRELRTCFYPTGENRFKLSPNSK